MPAAWARMIYVCGFLQDKGVLYRIRRPQLACFSARAFAPGSLCTLRACRPRPLGCITRIHVKELPLILDPDEISSEFQRRRATARASARTAQRSSLYAIRRPSGEIALTDITQTDAGIRVLPHPRMMNRRCHPAIFFPPLAVAVGVATRETDRTAKRYKNQRNKQPITERLEGRIK